MSHFAMLKKASRESVISGCVCAAGCFLCANVMASLELLIVTQSQTVHVNIVNYMIDQ